MKETKDINNTNIDKSVTEELVSFSKRLVNLMPRFIGEISKRETNVLSRGKITVPQMVIMNILHGRGRCIMRHLADKMAITTSAVTGLVDRMVKAGLIKRIRSRHDRRIVEVELTSKGKTTFKDIWSQKQKSMIEVFKCLNEKERETYIEIMEKVYNKLVEKN